MRGEGGCLWEPLPARAEKLTGAFFSVATVTTPHLTSPHRVNLTLRNMYRHERVPEPCWSHVTRWHQDPYSMGAYRYEGGRSFLPELAAILTLILAPDPHADLDPNLRLHPQP